MLLFLEDETIFFQVDDISGEFLEPLPAPASAEDEKMRLRSNPYCKKGKGTDAVCDFKAKSNQRHADSWNASLKI